MVALCACTQVTWIQRCFNASSAVMRLCTSTTSILFRRSLALSDMAFHTSLDVYTAHTRHSMSIHSSFIQQIDASHTWRSILYLLHAMWHWVDQSHLSLWQKHLGLLQTQIIAKFNFSLVAKTVANTQISLQHQVSSRGISSKCFPCFDAVG